MMVKLLKLTLELLFSYNQSHKQIFMNQISRIQTTFDHSMLNFSNSCKMPISEYYSMKIDSFKDSSLFFDHKKALDRNSKRSLRGLVFVPIGNFYNLIQISDIGDLFMQSFSFESDKEIDQEIISFHSKLREDYCVHFEEGCFDPLIDANLHKNLRTSKYLKSHYKMHNATSVKECIHVYSS
jgi:hypothetical protein